MGLLVFVHLCSEHFTPQAGAGAAVGRVGRTGTSLLFQTLHFTKEETGLLIDDLLLKKAETIWLILEHPSESCGKRLLTGPADHID